ncbi:D-sedoheptulose 7-phosphate isomerase [Chloroflexota bacterium]
MNSNRDQTLSHGIAEKLEESAKVKRAVARNNVSEIESIVNLVVEALKAGGKVIFFGNGGSAGDAQHLAAEMVGRLKLERQGYPAIALTTNTSILTAVANDYGYEKVFSRQIEALAGKKDVIIGISTSGDSPNVIDAIKMAKAKEAKTVVLTGSTGGKLAREADLALIVPSHDTQRIQEAHITIGHIICELVEKEISGTV